MILFTYKQTNCQIVVLLQYIPNTKLTKRTSRYLIVSYELVHLDPTYAKNIK